MTQEARAEALQRAGTNLVKIADAGLDLDLELTDEEEAKLNAYMEAFDLLMKDDMAYLVKSNEVINALCDDDYVYFLAFNNCALMVTAHANTNADIEALDRLRSARVAIDTMHQAIGTDTFSNVAYQAMQEWLEANLAWVRQVSIPIMEQGIASLQEMYDFMADIDADD